MQTLTFTLLVTFHGANEAAAKEKVLDVINAALEGLTQELSAEPPAAFGLDAFDAVAVSAE